MINRQIGVLLSAYRRDDYTDPEGFYVQLGTVLAGYPESVIMHVTSPSTGLQRTCKFPPSIAEVVEASDREMAAQARSRKLHERFKGRVPVDRVRGPTMAEKLCARFGIRAVPKGWDAVHVTQAAARHGKDFPNVVEELLRQQEGLRRDSEGGTEPPPEAA